MRISSRTTHIELAAIVTDALKSRGLSAILVGGAVVSIYTENKYESYDLDFVSDATADEIENVTIRNLKCRRKVLTLR